MFLNAICSNLLLQTHFEPLSVPKIPYSSNNVNVSICCASKNICLECLNGASASWYWGNDVVGGVRNGEGNYAGG